MLFKAETVGSKFFDDQLSKPEVSHFTFSKGMSGKFPLKYGNIKDLKRMLASRIAGDKQGIVFPRREDFLTDIIPSEENSCERFNSGGTQSATRPSNSHLIVFDENEPLYSDVVQLAATGIDLKSVVFGTPDLLASFGGENFEYVCLDIDGTFVPFQIQWIERKLPGGGDRTFFMGITEQAFMHWSIRTKSINFPNLTFSYAAIYFEKNNVNEVLCAFEKSDACALKPLEIDSESITKLILLDKDIFKQISQFTLQARLAQTAIIVLIASFSLVMIASLIFATSSEVKTQERSLAILRAFGVAGLKITLIFQMRSVIQLAYSLFFAVLVFTIFAFLFGYFAPPSGIIADLDIKASFLDLILPTLLTLVITQSVTFLVVILWSNRNKYVAEKLQGL